MLRYVTKIVIGSQHRQITTETELSEKRINGPDLYTVAATGISQLRGGDVIAPLGSQQRKNRKVFDDLIARSRTAEPLQ